MKTSTAVVVIVAVIVVLGGFYWWYSGSPMPAPAGQAGINGSTNQDNMGDGTGVEENLIIGTITSGTLGDYLSAYNGMTLYTFSKDSAGTTTCYGTCASNWPPYTVPSADAINVSAATVGTVGTVTRADGTIQVTYNDKPLYFYIKDAQVGDTTGQGVGGVWYVAKP